MLVLSWAFSVLCTFVTPKHFLCLKRLPDVSFYFWFCFFSLSVSETESDVHGMAKIRVILSGCNPSAYKTWLVFLLLCLSWAFSGNWWTGPHSSRGIFNLSESTEKPQCCPPVALQSNQYPSTAFLLLCLLPPGGKITTTHSRLHFGSRCAAQGGQDRSRGTPRRLVSLISLSGKQTTSFCHPFCCFPLKWLICTHTKYFGGMRRFLLCCPLCWMHYPLMIISILSLLRKCWSLLLYVLWL